MLNEQTVLELNRLFGLGRDTSAGKIRYRWHSTIQVQELGSFRVIPLTTSRELASESWNMQHCVANYDADCAKDLYQVFSIRDLEGMRVATLGLTYGARGWELDQCLGFRNAEVTSTATDWIDENGKHQKNDEPTDLYFLAQWIARLLNREDEA